MTTRELTKKERERIVEKADAFMGYLDAIYEIIARMQPDIYVVDSPEMEDSAVINILNSLSRTFDVVSAGFRMADMERHEWEKILHNKEDKPKGSE